MRGEFLPAHQIRIFKILGAVNNHRTVFTVNTFKTKNIFFASEQVPTGFDLKSKKKQLIMRSYLKNLRFLDLSLTTVIKKPTLQKNLIGSCNVFSELSAVILQTKVLM